ncbi:diguanylate cyclase, putative [Babesia ovis]|uniref:Diguanylate cyclase, putative n=1 Tax=Babesia ovis TaxID=5869 RepID=A0A9W5WTM0_BABOV|nr:diguanylate cyclase, putative [Babesia ovis]
MSIAKNFCTIALKRPAISAGSRAGVYFGSCRPSTGLSAKTSSFDNAPVLCKRTQHRNLSTAAKSTSTGVDVTNGTVSEGVDGSAATSHPSPSLPSEPLDRRTFIKLLTSVNDGNLGLVVALNKLKDELQVEGSRSYPFRARDLRVLAEFTSKLLALRDDTRSVDALCGAMELFKGDSDASAAFHLTRLFSSYNNCHGRTFTSSVFQRIVHNRIGMTGAKMLSQKKLDKLNESYESGTKCALRFLASAISEGDMDGLRGCCERYLFDFLQQGINYLERMGLKLELKILDIKEVKMDVFLLTIGGQRGDTIPAPFIMKQAVGHQIVVSLPKSPTSGTTEVPHTRQQNRDLIFQTFEKGAIAKMDVILKVRQVLRLHDTNGAVVWEDPRKMCTHKMTLESAIDVPSRGAEAAEPTDWTIVDINGVLNSNAPFTISTG